jgi:hypothetical protein
MRQRMATALNRLKRSRGRLLIGVPVSRYTASGSSALGSAADRSTRWTCFERADSFLM